MAKLPLALPPTVIVAPPEEQSGQPVALEVVPMRNQKEQERSGRAIPELV